MVPPGRERLPKWVDPSKDQVIFCLVKRFDREA